MCLIAYQPPKATFPADLVKNALAHNGDGFGVMYADQGRVHVKKTMGGLKHILKLLEGTPERQCVMHWRQATHGKRNETNAHPIPVFNKDKDGLDLWVVHNGILPVDTKSDPNKSDTVHFANLLRDELTLNPDLLKNKLFQQQLGAWIGKGNKLVFLDDKGQYTFINPDMGEIHEPSGCWVSNTYSLAAQPKLSSYFTHHGDFDFDDDEATDGYTSWRYTNWKKAAKAYGKGYAKNVTQAKLLELPAHHKYTPPATKIPILQTKGVNKLPMKVEIETSKPLNRGVEEMDLEQATWVDLYELVKSNPTRVTDFLFRFFSQNYKQEGK